MFGVTSAVELARNEHDVTLYEKSAEILTGASGSNHWRLHRGYHYPQSDATARETQETEPLFRARYEEAVIETERHYYAIADESWVSPAEYVDFLDAHGLEYTECNLDLVDDERIEQTLAVEENHVCPDRLRSLCWDELEESGVNVELETHVSELGQLGEYDHVVVATYAHSNSILPEGHTLRRRYKFEVCEVPIVALPERYLGNNIIVVYGPFMSTDHWGSTDHFAMGDYHHMRHHSSTGYEPDVPERYASLVNEGLIEDPDISNFPAFREHGQQYIPGVADAAHVGSLFTIRTILPDVEDTDARPTLVRRNGDVTTVFGGKLATSVQTAKHVVNEVCQ
jgi:hypothetical protein